MTTTSEEKASGGRPLPDDPSEIPGFDEAIAEYRLLFQKYRLDVNHAFDTVTGEHELAPQILPLIEQYEPLLKQQFRAMLEAAIKYQNAS